MKKFLGRVLSSVASGIPTCSQVCFASTPDFADNSYAMYQAFVRYGLKSHYKLVWLVYDRNRIREVHEKVLEFDKDATVVYKYSLRGIWTYIRSRYVFETHGLYPFLNLNQHPDKHICLWHGMPLKKVGASIGDAASKNCDYTISTSAVFQNLMARSFDKPLEKVLITGQPRNDLLFEDTDYFEEIQFDRSSYRKVGAWLPTYRKSVFGELRNDGKYEEGSISFLKVSDLERLDRELGRQKGFLFIKIHLMDALQTFDFPAFRNILVIKPSEFKSQLYPFLGACDYLLTDYSSVFIDYDITEKPIGFVMDDIKEYQGTRGLNFDNLESILPGPVICDYDSLIRFINNPVHHSSSVTLNAFYDNHSAERILNYLGLL